MVIERRRDISFTKTYLTETSDTGYRRKRELGSGRLENGI